MVDGGVPFHMASDQAGNVGRAYGVWDENQGIELRGRFIIDPDGVIQAEGSPYTTSWEAFCEIGEADPGFSTGTHIRRQGSHTCGVGAWET